MNKKTLLLLCIFLLLTVGCTKKEEERKEEGDLFAILESLDCKDSDLEIDHFESINEIEDASFDEELFGVWMNTDKQITYVFQDDGILKVFIPLYSVEAEMPYVCLERNGRKLFAADEEIIAYEGTERIELREFAASCYRIENGALYMVDVETTGKVFDSYYVSLQVLYKADENMDISFSLEANPLSLKALCGSWESEGFRMELTEENILFSRGEESTIYPVFMNGENRLELTKDEKSSSYGITAALIRNYEESGTKAVRELLLDYTGINKRDVPNLTEYLTDWHETYAYVPYYYSMTFTSGE